MDYTERMQNVTVIGAAGKMGSGILLLTAMEMADLSLKPENKGKQFILNALDISDPGLSGLMKYVRTQAVKAAEKKTVALRKVYEDRADLIENGQIIQQYIEDVMAVIRPTTQIDVANRSSLIFEAAVENPELKIKILSQINRNNPNKPWFFTNTSSIPISYLDNEAGLEGRILGVHFYNPPAVQRLVEVIKGKHTIEDLNSFATQLIKNLRKIIVPSNDFAGFIGNGHFMRDALHGMEQAMKLRSEMSFIEAVYIMNKISQDYMVRPMGIFQLIDYVGIDVCQYIMKVMRPDVKDENIHSPLLDQFIELGVRGGQNADGSQKNGFLQYERGRPVGIYDPDTRQYAPITEFSAKCDERLGKVPPGMRPWKSVVGNPKTDDLMMQHFRELKGMNTMGASLAIAYAERSMEIGKKLVSDGVAFSEKDVNTVMLTGFFHAYGPINNYLN
ncbi:MAG: 3-hydroxyacyl-CoA dehydrogenase family protein [Bacteroidetes bacterium]|nr:3-hydroxyacyl-CoA dehydrogenase family protein [Bacteroidota bacterium]